MTYVALIRGVNVVGRNALPMKSLSALLTKLRCANVRTYLQSGNAVFDFAAAEASKLAAGLTAAIGRTHGFAPHVIVLRRADVDRAIARNPFPQADANPTTLHLFFLDAKANRPNTDAMATLAANGEQFKLDGRVFYLYTPNGFGVSKLASRAERLLGVTATARNWRTVQAVAALMRHGST
jgi:uncharacterized protein (DUF1697 family)